MLRISLQLKLFQRSWHGNPEKGSDLTLLTCVTQDRFQAQPSCPCVFEPTERDCDPGHHHGLEKPSHSPLCGVAKTASVIAPKIAKWVCVWGFPRDIKWPPAPVSSSCLSRLSVDHFQERGPQGRLSRTRAFQKSLTATGFFFKKGEKKKENDLERTRKWDFHGEGEVASRAGKRGAPTVSTGEQPAPGSGDGSTQNVSSLRHDGCILHSQERTWAIRVTPGGGWAASTPATY